MPHGDDQSGLGHFTLIVDEVTEQNPIIRHAAECTGDQVEIRDPSGNTIRIMHSRLGIRTQGDTRASFVGTVEVIV